MNKLERAFNRVCMRFNLNPSNWLPHIKPDGVYEMGSTYTGADLAADFFNPDAWQKVPIESFSLYNTFWLICFTRREKAGTPKSKWESMWSFLSDVDMGVYDTTNWVPVEPT